MRVTRETRERTRQGLLDAARELFGEVGFAAATTRGIARRAGVGTGTLFNYFPGKEALGMALIVEGVAAAEAEFDRTRREDETLEEALFAFVATQLRHLRPCRGWLRGVLDAGASPVRSGELDGGFRARQLERIERWLVAAGLDGDATLSLHLWWTLYLGVLDFWTRDDTDHQEATLALLDRSMGLFVRGLREDTGARSKP